MRHEHALVPYPPSHNHEKPDPIHSSRNTQIINTCIVFRSWHISSTTSFVLSCIVIVGLGVLYEYLRALQGGYDRRVAVALGGGAGKRRERSRGSGRSTPEVEDASVGLLTGRKAVASG